MIEGNNFLVTRESLLRYAWASGDYNSIHFSDEDARNQKLPGVIVHGMLLLGMMNKKIEEFLKTEATLKLHHLDCRFVSMAFLGDSLAIKLEEIEFNTKALPHVKKMLQLSIVRTNDKDTVAAIAKAQLK